MKQLPTQPVKQKWLYADWPLFAFTAIMVAAATITSHGTFVFYSYILSDTGAYAATIVLTVGIPLLELAAILDKANRGRYLGGMLFLLFMEGMAQYFQGQAIFVTSVVKQFPNPAGIDLATFAAQPEGRVLPALYLAALSGVVVYFGYAASARVRDLRMAAGIATQPAASDLNLVAQPAESVNVDSFKPRVTTVNRPASMGLRRRQLPQPTRATMERRQRAASPERVDEWIAANDGGMSYAEISKQLGGNPSRQYINTQCNQRRAQLAALTVEATQ